MAVVLAQARTQFIKKVNKNKYLHNFLLYDSLHDNVGRATGGRI